MYANKLRLHRASLITMLAAVSAGALAQTPEAADSVAAKGNKEEGNRNVMLNAASANGPREISIGLPGGDVNVLENGLPVVFNSNPHNVNYNANHFGKQQFDFNLNGALGKGWFYSGSVYQNFDPGSFKLRFAQYQDRTEIYKFALTKLYNEGRGRLSAVYHYSNSHWLSNATTGAPFIYNGDGSVSEIPGFKLGTTSYLPNVSTIPYMDMRTGEVKVTSLYDATASRGNQITLLNNYRWDNGLEWDVRFKYDHALGSYLYQTPMSLSEVQAADGYYTKGADGTLLPYAGHMQSRMSCFNRGRIDETFLTSELKRKLSNMTWRVGIDQWHYHNNYASCTTMYDHTVQDTPELLYHPAALSEKKYYGSTAYYNFNQNASEYYKGDENKLAVYATHDWDVTPKLNLYYGARLEWQRSKGVNAAVRNADGKYVGRFANYHLGATAADGTVIAPTDYSYDWLNQVYTAALTYKITHEFGLTGDFTYNTQRPAMNSFAPAELPNVGKIAIPLGRAGIYYNNKWLSLTSLFSYIAKSNNNSTLNLINPNNPSDIKASALTYDIKTLGWTTDAVVKPFKGFEFHFLFTYQKPTYKKYETSVTFSDGTVSGINATGNIVTEIPKVLVELDPSYTFLGDALRVWASFRYFSKTYANIKNAYYFNGRWETFGGVDWKVNRHVQLGCTVINFLNQTGAKGSIAGAELVDKEQAAQYNGAWMAGSYIRPFTVEFAAKINF